MRPMRHILAVAILIAPATAEAGVVINEIFYNSPDDLDDLQWIELFNDGEGTVDLSEWTLDGGSAYVFPASTTIEPHGYVVAALNANRFTASYGGHALGPLKRPLKRGGERIELADAAGRRVDVARYKDADPWPVSADGYSASLERICPFAPGDIPENWAASPLSTVETKPGGTPGKRNVTHSGVLPPVIKIVSGVQDDLAPEQPLRVEAEVKGEKLREVNLLYRVTADAIEGQESPVQMLRDATTGRYQAGIPGQKAGVLIRYRIQAVAEDGTRRVYPAEHDLRPSLSAYVHAKWGKAKIPFGLILRGGSDRPKSTDAAPSLPRGPGGQGPPGGGRGPRPNFGGFGRGAVTDSRPPRGASTFVYVAADSGTMLFDYINIIARNNDRGFKLFFHKDRTLNGMRSLNMLFEGSEWSLMAEALAYDVYRRAGSPAPLTEFVRLWVDGRMVGYHLAVERVNTSFLRRNKVADDGNLYKILWMGRDVVSQHEKRTHTHQGHEDLLALTERLEKTSGDEQWKAVQENFNISEVTTYFAVNMVLSHWDGFFNNYFAYHDTQNGKWEMYPWDQDKTSGYYDGLPDDQVFFDMPLTYGMQGDQPPGGQGDGERGGRPGRRGPRWWRAGGYFSRPLLANPQFRKVFLARTKEILENIYTQEIYFPHIEAMAERLEEDVQLRAQAAGRTAGTGTQELGRNADLLKMHLIKRRQFLLEQEELRNLSFPASTEVPAQKSK